MILVRLDPDQLVLLVKTLYRDEFWVWQMILWEDVLDNEMSA
jgi:hypothetical protein